MIAAFVVLLVVALALGGYIAWDILCERKKAAVAGVHVAEDIPQTSEEPEPEPEPETEVKSEPSVAVLEQSEIRESVSATEVDKIMSDEVAASFIETSESKSDKTKQGIINIDTLAQNFENGEVVTLEQIKKKVKGFNQKTTYLKVLARGTLDKPLTVEADSFSLQAVKMIVLTGGKAVKRQ